MKILYLNVFKSITSRVVLLFYTKWEIFENGKMHSYAPDYKEISVLLMKRLSLISKNNHVNITQFQRKITFMHESQMV